MDLWWMWMSVGSLAGSYFTLYGLRYWPSQRAYYGLERIDCDHDEWKKKLTASAEVWTCRGCGHRLYFRPAARNTGVN